MNHASIIGIGTSVPKKILTNQDIVNMGIDTTDEWITSRTGIKQRFIADAETTSSDLAVEAAQKAIQKAKIETSDIDLILVATATPDYNGFPSTACIVQQKLGISNCGAFDISAACSGFNYAISTATQFIQCGTYKNILVIGVDCLSKIVNWEDRNTCILFGDGAGAAIVATSTDNNTIINTYLHASGKEADILNIPGGGTKKPFSKHVLEEKSHTIHMDGKAVFKTATNTILPHIKSVLAQNNKTAEDINCYIFHQANKRIIKFIKDKLNLTNEQVFSNIETYGNTSAASIPLAIQDAINNNYIKKGDLVCLCAFGAGFTWSTILLKWGTN